MAFIMIITQLLKIAVFFAQEFTSNCRDANGVFHLSWAGKFE